MKNYFNKVAMFVLPLSVALMSTSAIAEVTLNVDDNIKVTAINGKAISTSIFSNPKNKYTLTEGTHIISAKYDRLYYLRGDNHDYLKSDNITITGHFSDNTNYQLVMLDQPEKYEEARKYAENPILAVKLGNKIVVTESLSSESNANRSNMLSNLTSGIFGSKNDALSDNNKAIAAVNRDKPQQLAVKSTLDNFMQLWLQATPEERKKIRGWVLEK